MLCEVLLMHDERPLLALQMGEMNVEFVCDSGVCRSVINGKTQHPTSNTILVKAANGQSSGVPLSKVVQVLDSETGMKKIHSFVMAGDCPVNPCGRGLMSELGIGLQPAESDDTEPHYWDSLDLTQTGSGSVTDRLHEPLG